MKINQNIKKQIVYRSTHRGFKEMDLLLGKFVKKYIKVQITLKMERGLSG